MYTCIKVLALVTLYSDKIVKLRWLQIALEKNLIHREFPSALSKIKNPAGAEVG